MPIGVGQSRQEIAGVRAARPAAAGQKPGAPGFVPVPDHRDPAAGGEQDHLPADAAPRLVRQVDRRIDQITLHLRNKGAQPLILPGRLPVPRLFIVNFERLGQGGQKHSGRLGRAGDTSHEDGGLELVGGHRHAGDREDRTTGLARGSSPAQPLEIAGENRRREQAKRGRGAQVDPARTPGRPCPGSPGRRGEDKRHDGRRNRMGRHLRRRREMPFARKRGEVGDLHGSRR